MAILVTRVAFGVSYLTHQLYIIININYIHVGVTGCCFNKRPNGFSVPSEDAIGCQTRHDSFVSSSFLFSPVHSFCHLSPFLLSPKAIPFVS